MNQPVDIDILNELRRITKILALIASQNKTQKEQIDVLSNAGMQPKEIADILGTTPNTVRVTLAKTRKYSKQKRPKANKEIA